MLFMDKNRLQNRWDEAHRLLSQAERIICSTHFNPDGDGLGSQLALVRYLKNQGKECRILNPSALPNEYKFMAEYCEFEVYDRSLHSDWVKSSDLAVILDIGDFKRLNELGEDIQTFGLQSLSIDHHPQVEPNGFDYTMHDISACATGYLIWEYFQYMMMLNGKFELNSKIAYGLYIAVMTDTGSFRFNNTSPEAHDMASEMIRLGVLPHEVYKDVYEVNSVEKMRLMGTALRNIKIEGQGQLAWFPVTRKMIKEAGAAHADVSGFTDLVRTIGGVEVTLMIHEIDNNRCKANFRSKGKIRIDELARRLGGGGHPFAAGSTVEMKFDKAIKYVVSETLDVIKSQSNMGDGK